MIYTDEQKKNYRLKMDFNNMMKSFVGEYGISDAEISSLSNKIAKAHKAMLEKRANGKMDWRDLPHNQKDVVADIKSYVDEVKGDIDAFVVLGIGGSALGPICVQQAINHPFYNELSKEKRGGYPKLYVADNVDPERLSYLFEVIEPEKTLFNCISKSGSTSETMSQFMIIKELLEEKLGKAEAAKHIVCTTDIEKGNLIKIAKEEGYKTFIIPSGVGGRFSELTPVGLLPAAMCGIDIELMLDGAGYMDELSGNENIYENQAYMFAVLSYIALKQGKNMSVMMPYADSLKYVSDWFAQLWAESLGKKTDNDGNAVYAGQTPVKALGVTDQHSQVQLYTDGPFDKTITFISVEKYRSDVAVPHVFDDIPGIAFLSGHSLGELISAEFRATEHAVTVSGHMNKNIIMPEVNEFTLGQLIMLFEMQTAFAGELLGIDAFDQPGVEEGKNATYALLGKPGYEAKLDELKKAEEAKKKLII